MPLAGPSWWAGLEPRAPSAGLALTSGGPRSPCGGLTGLFFSWSHLGLATCPPALENLGPHGLPGPVSAGRCQGLCDLALTSSDRPRPAAWNACPVPTDRATQMPPERPCGVMAQPLTCSLLGHPVGAHTRHRGHSGARVGRPWGSSHSRDRALSGGDPSLGPSFPTDTLSAWTRWNSACPTSPLTCQLRKAGGAGWQARAGHRPGHGGRRQGRNPAMAGLMGTWWEAGLRKAGPRVGAPAGPPVRPAPAPSPPRPQAWLRSPGPPAGPGAWHSTTPCGRGLPPRPAGQPRQPPRAPSSSRGGGSRWGSGPLGAEVGGTARDGPPGAARSPGQASRTQGVFCTKSSRVLRTRSQDPASRPPHSLPPRTLRPLPGPPTRRQGPQACPRKAAPLSHDWPSPGAMTPVEVFTPGPHCAPGSGWAPPPGRRLSRAAVTAGKVRGRGPCSLPPTRLPWGCSGPRGQGLRAGAGEERAKDGLTPHPVTRPHSSTEALARGAPHAPRNTGTPGPLLTGWEAPRTLD